MKFKKGSVEKLGETFIVGPGLELGEDASGLPKISSSGIAETILLDDLLDVTIAAVQTGDIIRYDAGGDWLNEDVTSIQNHAPQSHAYSVHTGVVPTSDAGAPAGGTTDYILTKNSASDYDYSWQAISVTGLDLSDIAGGTAPVTQTYNWNTAQMTNIADITVTDGFLMMQTVTDSYIGIYGGTATNLGAGLVLFGQAAGVTAKDIVFFVDAVPKLTWDNSDAAWSFTTTPKVSGTLVSLATHNHTGVYLPIAGTAADSSQLESNNLAAVRNHAPISHAYSVHSGAVPTSDGGTPAGGSTGYVLKKIDGTDYNYSWQELIIGAHTHTLNDIDSGTATAAGTYNWNTAQMINIADITVTDDFLMMQTVTDSYIGIYGGTATNLGAGLVLYGQAAGISAKDIIFFVDANVKLTWDNSASQWSTGQPFAFGADPAFSITNNTVIANLNASLLEGQSLTNVRNHAPISHAYSVHSGAVPTSDGGTPTGGSTDQVLTKIDGTSYNYSWQDAQGGGALTLADIAGGTAPSTQTYNWNTAQMTNIADITVTTGFLMMQTVTDSFIGIYGGTATNLGAAAVFYGQAAGVNAKDILFMVDATPKLQWDNSADYWIFATTPYVGATAVSLTTHNHSGVYLPIAGQAADSAQLEGSNLAAVRNHAPAAHNQNASTIQAGSFGTGAYVFDSTVKATNFIATLTGVLRDDTDSVLYVSGGSTASGGANLMLYGGTQSPNAYDWLLRAGATNVLFWDNSEGELTLAGTLFDCNTTTADFVALSVGSTAVSLSGHSHDDLYYTESEIDTNIYTKTNLQTSGQASVHWGNITNEPATYAPSAHVLNSATHTVSGLTPGQVLTALTASTFGFASLGSHTHTAADISAGTFSSATGTYIFQDNVTIYDELVIGNTAGRIRISDAAAGCFFIPRNAGDTGWDGTQEFSWNQTSRYWTFDSTPRVGGSVIWHAGNDGTGTGLDADKLDTYEAAAFPRKAEAATITNTWTMRHVQIAAGYSLGFNGGIAFRFYYNSSAIYIDDSSTNDARVASMKNITASASTPTGDYPYGALHVIY